MKKATYLLIVLALVFLLFGCKKTTTVSISDCIGIKFYGENGSGTVNITQDYDLLSSKIYKAIYGKELTMEDMNKKPLGIISEIESVVNKYDAIIVDKDKINGTLKNGDKVKVEIKLVDTEPKIDVRIKEETVEYTVEGLK